MDLEHIRRRVMKKILLALACLAALLGCSFVSIITGTGVLVESHIAYSDFTALNVSGPFDLTISYSTSYDITIEADENVMNHISVTRSENELIIELAPYYSYQNITVKAYVSLPSLRLIKLFGATKATVLDSESFPSGTDFTAEIAGASNLQMPAINAQMVNLTVSGASTATAGLTAAATILQISGASSLKLSGVCGDIDASVTEASELDLAESESSDVGIWVTGASHATINMDGRLDAVISGASSLHHQGDVVLGSLDITGASQFLRY